MGSPFEALPIAGGDRTDISAELSADPIAAASIAQVYKGRLRSADGGWVAVKVQRPGLEESLLSDLDVLVESFARTMLNPF